MKKALILLTILLSLFMIYSCQEPEIDYEYYKSGWYLYNDGYNADIYIYYIEGNLKCAGNAEEKYTDELIKIMKESHALVNVKKYIRYIEDQYLGIPKY